MIVNLNLIGKKVVAESFHSFHTLILFQNFWNAVNRYSAVSSLNIRVQITSAFMLSNVTKERGAVFSLLTLTWDTFHLKHVPYLSHITNFCVNGANFLSNLQGLLNFNSLPRTMVTGTIPVLTYWLNSQFLGEMWEKYCVSHTHTYTSGAGRGVLLLMCCYARLV